MSPATQPIVPGGVPRVNLMPRSEVERRQRAARLRLWLWGAVAAVGVVLALVAAALLTRVVAEQGLAAENDRTGRLIEAVVDLGDVQRALEDDRQLQEFRAAATAADVIWTDVLGALTGVTPGGVVVTGFDLAVGDDPIADPAADPADATGLSGSLTLRSDTAVDLVGVVRAYRTVSGVADADATAVTADGGVGETGYLYQVTVSFDQSVYAPPAPGVGG